MRRRQFARLLFGVISGISFALGMGAKFISPNFPYTVIQNISKYLFVLAVVIMILVWVEWLNSYKLYKGVRYFGRYFKVKHMLEHHMIDAGIYVERGNIIELPRIKLRFDDSLSTGILKIRNSLKFERKLDNLVISSALGKYVVESHYISDDANWHIYELIDRSANYKMTFNSYGEYQEYSKRIPTYSLFLDARSVVKLQHILLVGVTGSGKTYSLYNFLLQFYNKEVRYELYYADPKRSSLAVLGETMSPDRTAIGMYAIIELLEDFVAKMNERKTEIKSLLQTKLDADYSDFGKAPYIFCFDEYASFVSALANEEKKTRDKVNALLSEVILQGRQLGFFMLIIMQKSDANLISTALRDNIPLKIVLGNSEQQTYVTAFGTGVEIPKRHYKVGEGVFTEPVLAPEPKLVQCPYLNFDILEAVKSTTPVM